MAPLIYNTRAVLGTCATFSTTAPLARNKKGGARRGGATVKKTGGSGAKKKSRNFRTNISICSSPLFGANTAVLINKKSSRNCRLIYIFEHGIIFSLFHKSSTEFLGWGGGKFFQENVATWR